jgi:hypothetical protein
VSTRIKTKANNMASTYSDLYKDYVGDLQAFVAKADTSELHFMRLITQGINTFQNETRYVDRTTILTLGEDGYYDIPNNILSIYEVRDVNNKLYHPLGWTQFNQVSDEHKFYRQMQDERHFPHYGYYAFFGLKLKISRIITESNTNLYIKYSPVFEMFSENSTQWSDWIDDDDFRTAFDTTGVWDELARYEQAFTAFAVGTHVSTKLGAMPINNVSSFIKLKLGFFNDQMEQAKRNKPTSFKYAVIISRPLIDYPKY